jgi:hypothetical protein
VNERVNRSTVYRLYKAGRLTVHSGARSLLVSKTEVAALLGRGVASTTGVRPAALAAFARASWRSS